MFGMNRRRLNDVIAHEFGVNSYLVKSLYDNARYVRGKFVTSALAFNGDGTATQYDGESPTSVVGSVMDALSKVKVHQQFRATGAYGQEIKLERKHDYDAGLDLQASEDATLRAGEVTVVPTGVSVQIPIGQAGFVCSRSGLAAKHAIFVLNSPGVIDSGFRGELKCIMFNAGKDDFSIVKGDRVAQLVIAQISLARPIVVQKLDDSADGRGAGDFGSTGLH